MQKKDNNSIFNKVNGIERKERNEFIGSFDGKEDEKDNFLKKKMETDKEKDEVKNENPDPGEQDHESEDEGIEDYKIGGYHPIFIG